MDLGAIKGVYKNGYRNVYYPRKAAMSAPNRRPRQDRLVRITEETHTKVAQLARLEGASHQSVAERAIEQYRRRKMLAETATGYAAMRESATESKEFEDEMVLWDSTSGDGLANAEQG